MKLQDIRDRQEVIRAELKSIEDDPTALEEKDGDFVDTLIAEFDDLETRRTDIENQLARIQNAVRVESVEAGDDQRKPEPFTQVYRNKRDPFENVEAVRTGMVRVSEARERALDAVEMANRAQWCDFDDDKAENATRLIQRYEGDLNNPSRDFKRLAWHILRTGTPAYYDDFREYMSDPTGFGSRSTTVGTGSLGYMLPFVLDPTIILSNTGSANPYRQVSRVVQTTSNTWNGVTSAGVNAAFLGEATAATDASPTVSQLQITPIKAVAWVFGSYESLEDSDLGAQLPRLFADAKDRLEESAFATGAGTTGAPQGAVTGATTGNTAAATAFAIGDVYGLQARLGARWRNSRSATWLANLYYLNKIRQFDTSGGGGFWANLTQGLPPRLLDSAIYESTSMSSATASATKALLYGDMEQYVIVDRVGMSVRYQDMVMSGTTGNLPTGEAGWYAFWRVGAKVAVSTALQVLLIQ